MALLLMALDWAATAGRRVIAFTVDHRLQPAGADWARRCADLCGRLGVAHQTLEWTGPHPASGVPAAARLARHRLLAEAARAAGAKVLLLGHTADDRLEAALMRAEGSTVGDPKEWSPSPVWPEGREIFILRPLLEVRRADLRAWLQSRGADWIEDPANEDPASVRARARRSLPPDAALPGEDRLSPPAARFSPVAGGGLEFHGPAWPDARQLASAIVCAGGGQVPPRGRKVLAIRARLQSGEAFVASLSGARIEAAGRTLRIFREAGALSRTGTEPMMLIPGQAQVWDGRFELTTRTAGLSVRALRGYLKRLPPGETARLKDLPPDVRPSLPLILGPEGPGCPILAQSPSVTVRDLVPDRYLSSIGAICREAAIGRVEIGGPNP